MRRPALSQPTLWLGALALAYLLLLIVYREVAPFYDGGIYFANVERLISEPLRWANLHFESHISPLYALLVSGWQWWDLGNMLPIFFLNFSLALLASVALYRLLERMFGALATREELLLATGAFALTPVLLTHAFHLNLDFSLALFFTIFLALLYAKQYQWAAASALAMMLSKETGILLFVPTTILYAILFITRPSGSLRSTLRALTPLWPLLLAPAFFLAYYGSYKWFGDAIPRWGHDNPAYQPLNMLFDLNLLDPSLHAFLTNAFLLNFHWILSGFIVLGLLTASARWSVGITSRFSASQQRDALFTALLLLGITFITTRVRPWNNPRYMLSVFPIFWIAAQWGLLALTRSARVRLGLWGLAIILIFASNFRTFDPLAKRIYGTIPFGSHPWLNMTSLIGPEWLRRDPQAYNLEFLELHYALKDLFASMRPADGAAVLAGPAANFYIAYRLDPHTFAPTWRPEGAIRLRWVDVFENFSPERLGALLGEQHVFSFVAFPNLDNRQSLTYLRETYPMLGSQRFGRGGHEIEVFTFLWQEPLEKEGG